MANDENGVRERIKALMRERRVTENKLSEGDSSLQRRLNSQLSHDSKLTVETLLLILDKFPDVSADWLLRGREQEKAVQGVASVGDNSIANNNNTTVNATEAVRCLVSQLEEKDKQLEEKDRQIDRLLQLLERQQVG